MFWNEIKNILPIKAVILSPLDSNIEIPQEMDNNRPSSMVDREIFERQWKYHEGFSSSFASITNSTQ